SAPHADDWPQVEASGADAKRLWDEVRRLEPEAAPAFRDAWARERAESFASGVEAMTWSALAGDERPEVGEALAASAVTWLATAVQRSDWEDARCAYDLLSRLDPQGRSSSDALSHAFSSVDAHVITERLDESDVREQARLFAF